MKRIVSVLGAIAAFGIVAWWSGMFAPPPKPRATAAPVQGALLADLGAPPAPAMPPVAGGKIDLDMLPDIPKRIDSIPVKLDGNFQRVTLHQLGSWDYNSPRFGDGDPPQPSATLEKFPKPIRELEGKPVSVEGFMIPVDVVRDRVKSFVLVTSPLVCCYGQVPKLNEWAMVTMEEGGSAPIMMDIPITVRGTLQMGEEVKNRSVVSLYRLSAKEVEGPRDL